MSALLVLFLWITPSVNRIDYAHPEKYLSLPATLGDAAHIRAVASGLAGTGDEDKLRAIGAWMRERLRVDEQLPMKWRDFDRLIADGTLAGCADVALVFGALARARGIPIVWVKSMDLDWMAEYQRDPEHVKSWRGHVFVEAFFGGRWRLVDPTQQRIYDDYDPRMVLLPGQRFAYDKGDDPAALTMSTHGEDWRKQARAFFASAGGGRPFVRGLHIVADTPVWQWIGARGEQLGVKAPSSFNTDFERRLPAAAGQWLVLTAIGSRFVLPSEYRDRYSPLSTLQLEEALRARASGRADRLLSDGTRVILLYARDTDSLKTEIDRLTLDIK